MLEKEVIDMNCPRCGKAIGGYVRAGTVENARVAKGCCPHCGSSMPAGYKVGYASSFAPPPPKKHDSAVCRNMAEKGRTQILAILLDGILLGVTVSLAGKLLLGVILGAVLCLLFGGYVLIRPNAFDLLLPDSQTTMPPPGNHTIWLAWALSLFLSFTVSVSEKVVPKGWPFLLAGVALTAFCTFRSRLSSYDEECASFAQAQRDQRITERILELYKEGKLTCGKCGRTVARYSHFSFAKKDSGVIILCGDCLPVAETGKMQLGDLTFYQV